MARLLFMRVIPRVHVTGPLPDSPCRSPNLSSNSARQPVSDYLPVTVAGLAVVDVCAMVVVVGMAAGMGVGGVGGGGEEGGEVC